MRTIAAMVVTMSCVSGASAQPPAAALAPATTKTLRESLLQADRALSAASLKGGMKTAFAEALAGNAFFLYDGAPVIAGKANVVRLLESQPVLNLMRVQWLPLVVTTSTDGSIGVTWGVMSISSIARDAGAAPHFGKYISAWRRLPDGAWQLAAHVEMGLTDEKVVIPRNLSPVAAGDPLLGTGAPFAKADIEFAMMAGARGAPAAFGEFAAGDAMTLPGTGEIVVGPAAVKSRMLESPAAEARWEWHPVYAEGSASGDLGFTVGIATITPPGAAATAAFQSKYLTVWRRQPDGSVRYVVDGGNGR